jgi:hypothetical protein
MITKIYTFFFSIAAIFLISEFLDTPLKATGCCDTDTLCSQHTNAKDCYNQNAQGCWACNGYIDCQCQWTNGKCSGQCEQ